MAMPQQAQEMVQEEPRPIEHQQSYGDEKNEPESKRCPHLKQFDKEINYKIINRFTIVKCDQCQHNWEDDDQLVFCLVCFKLHCDGSKVWKFRKPHGGHGHNHYLADNKHNLCIVIPRFEQFRQCPKEMIVNHLLPIWCYTCGQFEQTTVSAKLQEMRFEIYGYLQRVYQHKCKQFDQAVLAQLQEMQTQTNRELDVEEHKHVEDDLKQNVEPIPMDINGESFCVFDCQRTTTVSGLLRIQLERPVANDAPQIFGNRLIHSQSQHVYVWKFKIEQKNLTDRHQGPVFGISSTEHCFYGYGFQFADNRKEQCMKYKITCVNGSVHRKITPFLDSRIKNGSTITMRLDLVHRTLSFINIYGDTHHVCMDNIMTHPNRYYRLHFLLGAQYQCVTLLHYEDNEPIEHKSIVEQTRINNLLSQYAVLKKELLASQISKQRVIDWVFWELQKLFRELIEKQQLMIEKQQYI
eukprot:941816_1